MTERWEPGEIKRVGKKLYARCTACGKIVHLNKRFVGAIHICA